MEVICFVRIWRFFFYILVLWITLSRATKGKILIQEPKNNWNDWSIDFRGTSWTKETYSGKTVFAICSPGSPTEHWVLLPFIDNVPSSVKTLTVKFSFTFRICSSLNPSISCDEQVQLLRREENKPVRISELRKRQFDVASTVTAKQEEMSSDPPVAVGPKSTFSGTVKTGSKGIYLAIKNIASCLTLFTFEISYGTCPSQGVNLMKLKETVAPESNSTEIKVNGSCVDNAVPTQESSQLYAICQSSGEWTAGVNVSCVCTQGHQRNIDQNKCEECPKRTFKMKKGNEACSKCPQHSSQNANRTECRCDENFYRAEGEDPKSNCTTIPSSPLNGKAPFVNASAVQLSWKEPQDTGGRSDVLYDVACMFNVSKKDCGSKVRFYPKFKGLNSPSVFVTGLLPFKKYTFKVFARNGVSSLSKNKPNYLDVLVTTKESIPGMPADVVVKRTKDYSTANIRWLLDEPNGKILFYEVQYRNLETGSVRIKNSTYKNITIRGLVTDKAYSFKVRAFTSVGFGEFSKESKVEGSGSSKGLKITDPNVLYPVIGIGAFVLLLLIIICVLCCRRRNSNMRNGIEKLGLEMLPSDGQRLYIDPSTYGDLLAALTNFASEINKSYVKLEKIIGGGEFGEVHKGILNLPKREAEVVAVKLLKHDATLKSRDDFLSEAAVLGQFKHSNVIEMKGVVTKSAPMMIILEYMENGSLDNFLKTHDNQLTTLQLVGMARGVASGMAYLAEMNFIHRDLAARNILVAENMACKVADFGLSRELEGDNPDSEYLTQGGKIAVRWTALEAIKYRKFSSASDVWSYGILLWEIMTYGERPYWDWTNFQVMDRIEAGYRLPNPANCPKVIYNIMLDCWIEDKTRRPRFPNIVKQLEELIRSPDLLRDDMIDRVSRANTIDFDQIDTVPGWLDSIHMGQYKPNFEDAGYVALKQLVEVGDSELDVIGVKLIGHRNKIKKNLKGLHDYLQQNENRVSEEVKL